MFPSTGNGSSMYRSPRAVKSPNQSGSAVSKKSIYLIVGIVVLGMITLTPIIFIERSMTAMEAETGDVDLEDELFDAQLDAGDSGDGGGGDNVKDLLRRSAEIMKKRAHEGLARGVAGLSIDQTPALIGAKQAKLKCGSDVKESVKLAPYWNDPQGKRDVDFVTPFRGTDKSVEQFLTFEPDQGGWNNIRMSLENIIVFAAATGRTLVLPPKEPMYLLGTGEDHARSFGDFFDLQNIELNKRVKIITMQDFLKNHGAELVTDYESNKDMYEKLGDMCMKAPKDSPIHCEKIFKGLRESGTEPKIDTEQNCFVFDTKIAAGDLASDEMHLKIDRFCGTDRKPAFYNSVMQNEKWIHWNASNKKNHHRLLLHFYNFMYFTDPAIDNYYKRFVRDFLHYNDEVYCVASKVIHAIQQEARKKKLTWSSLHVRRGDLQYKKVLISAEEWYNNTKEVWKPKEILYLATDETDQSFFEPFQDHGHTIRFLDDYKDVAGLDKIDSSYLGMIDTIVASHGRAFAGTWFSTFSGYINRLRGYNGRSMKDSWYGYHLRKEVMREWMYPEGNYPAREWPIGWVGIDSDELVEHERHLEIPIIHRKKMPVKKEDLVPDEGFERMKVARGISGRPLSETPAVKGAKRGSIQCDINVDSMAYWNDPVGSSDLQFKSPFAHQDQNEKYVTYSSDRGGWNNVRMEFEVMYVLAAVLGRTLVLPPKEAHYLLNDDPKNLYRGVADFFPIMEKKAQQRVKVISFEEFLETEGGPDGQLTIPEHLIEKVLAASEFCDNDKTSAHACLPMLQYLEEVGHLPNVKAADACILFDKDYFNDIEISDELEETVLGITGFRRQAYFDKISQKPTLMHFRGHRRDYRVRAHFYGFVVFTDPKIDHYYKRLVRDTLHYNDEIFCAAGKIVKALQAEFKLRGDDGEGIDPEIGTGGFSALHVRNGKDFPHPKVQIPASEWYENTFEIWEPNEILYIATDEKNKTWFNDLAAHHQIRFIEDYYEIAGLSNIDPDYYSMIDAVVASRGRVFAGTWFSTFSGYVTRLRGYYGMSQENTWYPWLDRKDAMHTWKTPSIFEFGHEWPDGWIGIDTDEHPYTEKEKRKSAIF